MGHDEDMNEENLVSSDDQQMDHGVENSSVTAPSMETEAVEVVGPKEAMTEENPVTEPVLHRPAVSHSWSPDVATGARTDQAPLIGLPMPDISEPGTTTPRDFAPGGSSTSGGSGSGGPVPGGLGSGANDPPRRRRPRVVAAIAAGVLLAGGLGAGLGAAFGPSSSSSNTSPGAAPEAPATPASNSPSDVSKIANAVEPALVNVRTDVATPTGEALEEAAGTGMIITSGGEVLTNNHVIDEATSISVTVAGHSGSYKAKVLGYDSTHDVALLQIEGLSNLPTVTFGDSSKVTVGDNVVAIGNALGLGEAQSVVTGIVSAIGRTITASDDTSANGEVLHNLIETDAPIVPGDSGGPLLNSSGDVIGMDTAALSSEQGGASVGFAIPINQARSIVTNIANHNVTSDIHLGEAPFLGIDEQPQTGFGSGNSASAGTSSGVTLGGVVQGSPAEKAGFVEGDVITAVNGIKTPNWTALTNAIAKDRPGEKVSINYLNTSGTAETASVTLTGIPR